MVITHRSLVKTSARILLYLLDHPLIQQYLELTYFEAPAAITAREIANGIITDPRHLTDYTKDLVDSEYIDVKGSKIEGKKKQKIYFLTKKGNEKKSTLRLGRAQSCYLVRNYFIHFSITYR